MTRTERIIELIKSIQALRGEDDFMVYNQCENVINDISRIGNEPPSEEELQKALDACNRVLPSPILQAKAALTAFLG